MGSDPTLSATRHLAFDRARQLALARKMLRLVLMAALVRRRMHMARRDTLGVARQSTGEVPDRRVLVLPRNV